jgi:hypothetical protein
VTRITLISNVDILLTGVLVQNGRSKAIRPECIVSTIGGVLGVDREFHFVDANDLQACSDQYHAGHSVYRYMP